MGKNNDDAPLRRHSSFGFRHFVPEEIRGARNCMSDASEIRAGTEIA